MPCNTFPAVHSELLFRKKYRTTNHWLFIVAWRKSIQVKLFNRW